MNEKQHLEADKIYLACICKSLNCSNLEELELNIRAIQSALSRVKQIKSQTI